MMYVSRLSFSTLPGKTHEATEALKDLCALIATVGSRPRILRTHYASLGEADIQLEQEIESLAALEEQIRAITAKPEFQRWSALFSTLLRRSPKREIFERID